MKRQTIFFYEYTLVPREKIGLNSGATYKDQKTIVFDWQLKNYHEALTLFIHEAAHAMGALEIEKDAMLMEGHKYRESFLAKLEEGLVSDKQNEMEFGELNYTYVTINTFDDAEEFHKNNFKTQPTHKYSVNNVYYKALQLLLGINQNLMVQLMFANNQEEKNYFYQQTILVLKEQLSAEEFLTLVDCACALTLNYSYHGCTVNILNYLNDNKNFKSEEEKKEYLKQLKNEFPKNYSHAKKRNLFGKSIFDSINDLCLMTVNVLIKRLKNNEYDNFRAIKESCIYLTKIDNNCEKLVPKTSELKAILFVKIKELCPQLINISCKDFQLSDEDKFILITQIISLASFTNENTPISFIESDNLVISINNRENYLVKKENIYVDDEFFFLKSKPIGYRIILQNDESLTNIENLHKPLK